MWGRDGTYGGLEVEEGAGVESEEPNFTGGGRPVDENEREGLAPVAVVELVREQHVAGRVLGEFWWDSK